MVTRRKLYKCDSCDWYIGAKVLKRYAGECPNCCTVIDTEKSGGTTNERKELK